MFQSVRQEFLYPWRNRWNCSWDGYGPLGGPEVPVLPCPAASVVNSNYTEGFAGYPHNFSSVIPNRILEIPSAPYTNWWGWATNNQTLAVNPTNNPNEYSPAWIMDDPTHSWVVKARQYCGGRTFGFYLAIEYCRHVMCD